MVGKRILRVCTYQCTIAALVGKYISHHASAPLAVTLNAAHADVVLRVAVMSADAEVVITSELVASIRIIMFDHVNAKGVDFRANKCSGVLQKLLLFCLLFLWQ